MKESILRKVILVCSGFLFVPGANADELNIPNAFSAGTAAVADEVNANFDAVAASVNDNNSRIMAIEGIATTSDVTTFFNPDGTPAAGDVVGSATLQRTAAGIRLWVDTTMLVPGDAYTLWWVIFNDPASCDMDGCNGSDFPQNGGDPAVEASVMNATGRVVLASDASFNAFLPVGFSHTNTANGGTRQNFGTGLQDVEGAEVHVIIRSHGPSSGNSEQTSAVNIDCDNAAPAMGCYDPQSIAFQPPM